MNSARKTHISSLRTVRDATEFSQVEFAREAGTARAVIENVEMGRSKLTGTLAQRVSALFGVDIRSLYTTAPLDFAGNPYTKKSWSDWKAASVHQEMVSQWIERSKSHLALAFNAAYLDTGGRETPHKIKALYCLFSEWLMETIDALKIREGMERILDQHFSKTHPQYPATLGAVRGAIGDNPAFQARDKREWKDEEVVSVEEIVSPVLLPLTEFLVVKGKPVIAERHTQRRAYRIILPGGELFQTSENETNFNRFAGTLPRPPSAQPSPSSPPSASPPKSARRPKASPAPGKPKK